MQAWAQVAHLRDCSTFRDLLSGALTAIEAALALHLGKNRLPTLWSLTGRAGGGRWTGGRCAAVERRAAAVRRHGGRHVCGRLLGEAAHRQLVRGTPRRECVRHRAFKVHCRTASALAPGCNQMASVQVSVVWRDAYTASSLLCAYGVAGLAPAQPMAQQADGMPEKVHGTTSDRSVAMPDSRAAINAAAATRALRQLDMATLLGGPLFRPQLDACIGSLQTSVAADCQRAPSLGVVVDGMSVATAADWQGR